MTNDVAIAHLHAAQASITAALAALEEPEPIPPPPEPAGKPRFGLYPGADPSTRTATVAKFEQDTGIDVAQVGGNQDMRYEGAKGSVVGVFGVPWKASAPPVDTVTCAIQLAFTGGPYGDTQGPGNGALKRKALQATVDGKNDDIYTANLERMKASQYDRIVLRLGSEGDIPFPPHSFHPGTEANAKGNDDTYRAAWVHVHEIFKAGLGDRVRFSYTTTIFAAEKQIICADGKTRTALEAGWPGADLTDIVGLDCYLGSPLETVKRLADAGLAFAKAHGKPAAFDEWGITPDGHKRPAAEQCAYMAYMAAAPVEYASFFAGWARSKWPDAYTPAARKCLAEAWS
jgi:hypothetical protein